MQLLLSVKSDSKWLGRLCLRKDDLGPPCNTYISKRKHNPRGFSSLSVRVEIRYFVREDSKFQQWNESSDLS